MRFSKWLVIVGFFFSQIHAANSGQAGKIIATIDKFNSDSGLAVVCLFNQATGFPTDFSKAYKKNITKIKGRQVQVVFDSVPYARYAICALHAVNNDTVMKTGKNKIPTEGYGVSNNAEPTYGPPLFQDAQFVLVVRKKEILIHLNE
ncbi:MAG: DUF2141 domain-containing protein [Chitinivibrionales bacterium]|nr:DUF2141 domain-containing protein [Chitinivibrionales bacterium]